MYSTKQIREDIADHLNTLEALNSLAKEEKRDLTDEEQKTFNETMELIGSQANGDEKASGLYAKLETAERFERLRASSQPSPTPAPLPSGAMPQADGQTRIIPVNRFGKLKAYSGNDATAKAYGVGQWLKATILGDDGASEWCANNGNGIFAVTHTEGTDGNGGYLVPDPLAATVIDVIERYATLRPLCRVVPMTSDTLKVPKRLTGLTVDYPGEATASTESNKTWGQVSLAAVLRTVLTKFSKELRDDSLISIVDDLTMEIGRAFGNQEDNEIVNGDGTGTYGSETGILSALHANAKTTLASGETAFSDLALTDLDGLVGSLPEKYHTDAVWLMRRSTWQANIYPLLVAAGGTGVQDFGAGPRAAYQGYPVEFTDQMPASGTSACAALFGSFRDGVIIGDRGEYSVMASEHRYFEEMAIGLIAGRRYDVNVHSTGSAATDRAIVGLFTAAS